MMYSIYIPRGIFSSPEEDDAARKRRELREKLLRGEEVVVTQSGQVEDKNKKTTNEPAIVVPEGKLAQPSQTEDDAARKRRELREKLLRGEEVIVTQSGEIEDKKKMNPNESAIVVPEGKLAASFYWYERDPDLLTAEVAAMKKFFPQFQLQKLGDGRLCWVGFLAPTNIRRNAKWLLQVIYDHNHPHNTTYGGSIKVYAVEPDLEKIRQEIGSIPHTLIDSSGHLYLCTARPEDVKVGRISTSAASGLSWAAKWITAFELWIAGDISTSEFAGHNI